MKKLLLAMALLAASPCFAQEKPASEASIRELIALTDAKNLLNGAYAQIDGMMEQSIKQSLGDRKLSAEQETLLAEMRSKTVALIRSELSWEKLEPDYIRLYAASFSQSDIDGILKFYKTPSGQALLKKMPVLTQNLMQMVMQQMQGLAPKVRALGEEYERKLKATQ